MGLQLPPLGEVRRGLLRVGILGAAGYTGGELIRLLTNHPQAEIVFANSGSNAGNRVCDVARAIEDVVAKYGLRMGVWSGHGMGADLGDGVDVGVSNTMEIVPNMILTLHPSVQSDSDGLLYGNTWLATEDGPENLTPDYAECCFIDELRTLIR